MEKKQEVSKSIEIKACVCQHAHQDSLYGKGNRVHTKGKDTTKSSRCTVCGGKPAWENRLAMHAKMFVK